MNYNELSRFGSYVEQTTSKNHITANVYSYARLDKLDLLDNIISTLFKLSCCKLGTNMIL